MTIQNQDAGKLAVDVIQDNLRTMTAALLSSYDSTDEFQVAYKSMMTTLNEIDKIFATKIE